MNDDDKDEYGFEKFDFNDSSNDSSDDRLKAFYPITDVYLFCKDIRIVVYDFLKGNIAKNSGNEYKPLIDPKAEGIVPVELPEDIQKELDRILPLEYVIERAKKKFKYDADNEMYLTSEEIYSKLCAELSDYYVQHMFSLMVDDGFAELCCDEGKLFYRLTIKGKRLKKNEFGL